MEKHIDKKILLKHDLDIKAESMVFKSKYPKDYAKRIKLSNMTLRGPLIGENDYLHAKVPKFTRKIEIIKNLPVKFDSLALNLKKYRNKEQLLNSYEFYFNENRRSKSLMNFSEQNQSEDK